MHSTRCRRHVSLSLLTHTHTHTDAYARTWLTHLGPSHKPVQDIAEILLRCIWKWNSSWRCDTCLPFVLLLGVHKDSRISLCLLATNKQLIRETARLCLYSINVCLFSFAGSPCNMFSIEQRHIRIWSSDLFPVSTFLCVVFQPYLLGSRGSYSLWCVSLSLIKAHFSNATWHFQGCFLVVVVGAIHQLCWPPVTTTHQEICHAGRGIIKYFHLCIWCICIQHQLHTLCMCVYVCG